jgi:hypothetical protein
VLVKYRKGDLRETPEYERILSCNDVIDSGRDEQGVACATPTSANDQKLYSDTTILYRAHTRQSSC